MKGENIPPPCRNIKTDNAERTHTLPPEIIEYILSRLPVKSLLKFRCVSKSWLSLIDSKSFIKTHFGNSTKNATFTRHKIILNYAPYYRLKFCSLLSLLNESFTDPFKFDESIKIRCDSICLVGCCNGLVCILLEKKYFFLWNPSTKMSKKLPDIDHMVKYGKVTKYGFGYDESSGDYKVFAIISVFWTTSGKVYSLKANSWKIMKERNVSSVEGVGKFASGKLHWVSRIGIGLDSSWDIVSFDLQSEVYRMVEQPCYSERGFRLSLGVLGGCLSVLCDYRKTHFDVWIMKQYGVKESWDKLVTVSYSHCPWEGQFLTPICVGSNGEIILSYGSTFIIYYPKHDVLRHPSTIYLRSFCEADIYVESLVSLVPDGDPTPETVE